MITKVIELKSNLIVVANGSTLKMGNLFSGECVRTLTQHKKIVFGLVNLNGNIIATYKVATLIRVNDIH